MRICQTSSSTAVLCLSQSLLFTHTAILNLFLLNTKEFSVVIVDEACQVSEAACLIPFKFNPSLVVLVGDPKQLPVVTRSQQAETNKSNRSLFERLRDIGWPVHFLRVQYRMNKDISVFPSRTFYHNRLSNSEEVLLRLNPPWYNHKHFPSYLFVSPVM